MDGHIKKPLKDLPQSCLPYTWRTIEFCYMSTRKAAFEILT